MLYRNQVLQHKPSGVRWRVLDIDTSGNGVWLFNLEEKLALPELTDRDYVEDGNFFVELERPLQPSKLNPSTASKKRREEARGWIAPLIATPDIYAPSQRSALVLARAEELGCSPQTLYSYLRAWWRNGQNVQALTCQFHRSGNVAGATGKRGRPSKYGIPTYQLTQEDYSLIPHYVQVFLKDELKTLERVFQEMLETHYGHIDGDGRLIVNLQGERPSLGQFRYHMKKHLPAELVIRSRKGNATYELEHRPVLGSVRHATYTVADTYEIDSTIADVVLVHEHDRSRIIGKPSLYFVVDRKVNLIVGFYAGLEEPSWPAAKQAILSICEDKKALCQRHGVPYNPDDWPAHRIIPKEILGDRGPEMIGQESDKIPDAMEITLTNLPPRRADWKPNVECDFKLIQRSMRGLIPGYVPPENFGKRQTKDYGKDAVLTLKEFRKVIVAFIIRHNNSPMPNYKLAPQYVFDSLQPTPINLWNTEIRERAGLPTIRQEHEVRLALLPKGKAIVSRKGIQFGACFYSAPEALEKGWFVTAGEGHFEVDVSYDLRLVDSIYIHDANHPEQCFEAKLLEWCSHYQGLSHREVDAYSYLAGYLKHTSENEVRQRKSDFHRNLRPTIEAAKAETKTASQGISRSARKKDTRAAREDALRQERQEIFGPTSPTSIPAAPAPVIPITAGAGNTSTATKTASTQSKSRQDKFKELMNGR